jgi:hypothetical protein
MPWPKPRSCWPWPQRQPPSSSSELSQTRLPSLAVPVWPGLRPQEGESEADKEKREKELAKPLRRVGLRKYASVNPSAFGLAGGKKRIVVLRTSGGIVGAWRERQRGPGAGGCVVGGTAGAPTGSLLCLTLLLRPPAHACVCRSQVPQRQRHHARRRHPQAEGAGKVRAQARVHVYRLRACTARPRTRCCPQPLPPSTHPSAQRAYAIRAVLGAWFGRGLLLWPAVV